MPKLRAEDTAALNVRALEEATYESRKEWRGTVPPKNTRLHVLITKMWWSETNPPVGEDVGEPMLKLLVIADGNVGGDGEEYEGLPMWENYALTPSSKWKWDPFLQNFGLTIRDVKTRTFVAAEDDNNGAPIEKIKDWVIGSDAARATIFTSREMFRDEWQAHVAEWMEFDPSDVGDLEDSGAADDDAADEYDDDADLDDQDTDDDLDDDDADDDADDDLDDDDQDDDDADDDDADDQPEQEQVTRGRRAAAATRPARSARPSRAAPARPAATPARTGRRTARTEAPAAPARSGRGTRAAAAPAKAPARGGRAAAKPAAAAPARGRKSRGSSADPPF